MQMTKIFNSGILLSSTSSMVWYEAQKSVCHGSQFGSWILHYVGGNKYNQTID